MIERMAAKKGGGEDPKAKDAKLVAAPVGAKARPAATAPVAKGRPGRKPKQNDESIGSGEGGVDAVPEAGDDVVDPSVQIVEKLSAKQRAKDRRAKEKALKEALERSYHGTEEDLEARRNKLKALIKLGKERGFLTYSEINDHLPDNLVDAEAIDSIISTFGDMGIQVFDQAPDAETLLMNENVPAATTDEDAEEEAEAALSTVDAEFGRTTDPVRMYMREMGSVELLTREGEIEIAKRIEDGLKHMVMAISACPTTIAQILEHAEKIRAGELPIDEVVDGLVDPAAEDFPTARGAASSGDDEEDEAEENTDIGASGMTAAQLETQRTFLTRYLPLYGQTESRRLGYALDDAFYSTSDSYFTRLPASWRELDADRLNRVVRAHLAGRRHIAIAIVTRNAAELADAIASERESPITYAEPKPDEVVAEDRVIQSYRLGIPRERIRVVPVAEMFR
ncbi:MAG: hypothetical protein HUU29_07595 [Planctomycetaceae bacterium]|nr:hypothetical protein [Planctomycetaceae bacterium]